MRRKHLEKRRRAEQPPQALQEAGSGSDAAGARAGPAQTVPPTKPGSPSSWGAGWKEHSPSAQCPSQTALGTAGPAGAPQPRAAGHFQGGGITGHFQGGGIVTPGPLPLPPRPVTTVTFPASALWKGGMQCQEHELFMTLGI